MSIKYAILGLLSWKPSTGYELKKIFEESSTMHWSGNNNQVYKALLQLSEDDLVINEVQHQQGAPSKKIYTITDNGLSELKAWVQSEPAAPEFKKPFLTQLAWADQLNQAELSNLLLRYENEVRMQLLLQQEKIRRGLDSPNRSLREKFLWDMIAKNHISSLEGELEWVQEVRTGLFEKEMIEEKKKMNYKIIENKNQKYIELLSAETPLYSEQDAVDLVALSFENETGLLMIHNEALSEDFFNLKTGIAGAMLQKLVTYQIKTAAIVPEAMVNKGRFKEMIMEANKGNHFRVFQSKEAAELWLLG